MEILIIRHGQTHGNSLRQYIGTTDEPLCPEGRRALESRRPIFERFAPDRLCVSPLLRCRQTAEILFPGVEQQVEPELRECDFGLFEGKNYEELKDVPAYRRWLESGGELPFPEGESRGDFTLRCCHSFRDLVEDAITKQCRLLVLVVHGGTIMSILERYAVPARSYFEWQVGNGCGFLLEADPLRWQCSREISLKETFTL